MQTDTLYHIHGQNDKEATYLLLGDTTAIGDIWVYSL